MKWRKAVIAAVLLAVPMWAWAQTVQQDGSRADPGRTGTGQGMLIGGMTSDTLFKIPRLDNSGNLKVVDGDRDRDMVSTWSDVIPTDSLRTGASGDSSSVIALGGARHLVLAMKGCPKYSSTMASAVTLVAIQLRLHINSQTDSSSTMPIYTLTTIPAAGYADTFSVGQVVLPAAGTPGSSEFVVKFSRSMCNYHNTTGNTGLASTAWPYPGGIAIPLDNLYGRDIRLSNISIRARVLVGPALDNPTFTLIGFGK